MQLTLEYNNCKNDNFPLNKCDDFLIYAQNIDCGYSLEPPHCGGSNEYLQFMFKSKSKIKTLTHVNPSFT